MEKVQPAKQESPPRKNNNAFGRTKMRPEKPPGKTHQFIKMPAKLVTVSRLTHKLSSGVSAPRPRPTHTLPASSPATTIKTLPLLLLLLILITAEAARGSPSVVAGRKQAAYFGTPVGRLAGRSNNVSGLVYAVDEQTLFIRNFSYDGLAPDAYFWSSVHSAHPAANNGFIVPDEKGSTKPLESYTGKDLVLRLPEGKTLGEIHWLSVWSRERGSSLGEIQLSSKQLNTPRPLEIAPLTEVSHGTRSGPITIVDAQTLLVPDLHYDGLAPDAYFWLSRGGKGLGEGKDSLKLRDENGSVGPLKKYSGDTVVVTLPDELTVHDFDHFGIWCQKHQVVLGETRFPAAARVPPSPKMLGIKPENKLNCEILHDELGFEIRWVLDGDDIVMQLVGKIEPHEYMAFGLGKDDSSSKMERADAVLAWVDRRNGQVHALDYYLGSKAACSQDAKLGTCPDARIAGASDSLTLLHGAIVNGFSMVTFKRPQLGVDELYDQHVYSDGQQSVLWAIGPLNERHEPALHRLRARQNMFIDFARNPQWNCPTPDLNATMHSQRLAGSASDTVESLTITTREQAAPQQPTAESAPEPESRAPEPPPVGGHIEAAHASTTPGPAYSRIQPEVSTPPPTTTSTTTTAPRKPEEERAPSGSGQPLPVPAPAPWFVPALVCPEEHTLYAQLGPTGGRRGYEALTGLPAWGVAWYINGLMAPELVLERGQSYRFVVEGGNDKTSVAGRHPLYLTDSPEGGFDFKTDEQRLKERTFAGVGMRPDGLLVPTAEGRLCEWRPTNATLPEPDLYPTFAAYQRSLRLECIPGQAQVLKFTPDLTWPDQLYYQCYTHRFMGWRIRLVDSCAGHLSAARASSSNQKSNRFKMGRRRRSEPQRWPQNNYERRLAINLAELEPDQMEHDMLLLNSSILHQSANQPTVNMSALEELVRVWPQAVEFADGTYSLQPPSPQPPLGNNHMALPHSQLAGVSGGPESALEAAFVETQFGQLLPIELHNLTEAAQLFHSSTLHQLNHRLNHTTDHRLQQMASNKFQTLMHPTTTTAKPATKNAIQGYVKRLASFYYPVHQQLASILQPSIIQSPVPQQLPHHFNTNTNSNNNKHLNNQIMFHPHPQPVAPHPVTSQAATSQGGGGVGSSFSLSSLVPRPKIDLSKSSISKKLNKLRFKPKTESPTAEPMKQPPKPSIEFNYHIFNSQLAELDRQNKQLQSLESLINWQRDVAPAPLNYGAMGLFPPPRVEDFQQQDFTSGPPPTFSGGFTNGSHQFNGAIPMELSQYAPSGTQPAIFVARMQPQSLMQVGLPFAAGPHPQLSRAPSWQYPPNIQQHQHQAHIITGTQHPQAPTKPMSSKPSVTHETRLPGERIPQPAQPSQAAAESAAGEPDQVAIERYSKQASDRMPATVILQPLAGLQWAQQQPQQQLPQKKSTNSSSSYNSQTGSTVRFSAPIKHTSGSPSDFMEAVTELSRINSNAANETSDYQQSQLMGTDLQNADLQTGGYQPMEAASSHPTTAQSLEPQSSSQQTTVEPLFPSVGPPVRDQQTLATSQQNTGDAAVLTSNLLEPSLSSTLVSITGSNKAPLMQQQQQQQQQQQPLYLNSINYDQGSFAPLELSSAASSMVHHYGLPLKGHLRQATYLDSPTADQLRQQPPVQVASYLAQRFARPSMEQWSKQANLLQTSASSQPAMQTRISLPPHNSKGPHQHHNLSMVSQQQQQQQHHDENKLILLRPALGQSSATGSQPVVHKTRKVHTYPLQVHYLRGKSVEPMSSEQQQQSSSSVEGVGAGREGAPNANRLAGFQFERLSSLSSAPSTSFSFLDPMHASTSQHVASLKQAPSTPTGNGSSPATNSAKNQQQLDVAPTTSGGAPEPFAQQSHRKSVSKPIGAPVGLVEKPLADNMGSSSSSASDKHHGTLFNGSRDNSTDNAILSHVMSLIHSNAIPSPPLVALGASSSYSSYPDYFNTLIAADRSRRSLHRSLHRLLDL